MKTLIEIYDERPMENVLSTEVFRPEKTVFVCPDYVARSGARKRTIRQYFAYRKVDVRCEFVAVDLLDAEKTEARLQETLDSNPDCAVDISGGGDTALFSAGVVVGKSRVPVFTYSRKKNTFFNICGADFADGVPCSVRLDCASCFLMAGGEMLRGREDNALLAGAMEDIQALWRIYCGFRQEWIRQITYLQRISQSGQADGSLHAEGAVTVKGDHGMVTGDENLLRELAAAGLIRDLRIGEGSVSFDFKSALVRFWLRDVGSALETFVYRECVCSGIFDDVCLSAVVNWETEEKKGNKQVTNEIDVMAVKGVKPVFISCKATEIKTEALNELAILRDRFGGEGSLAVIVTSASVSSRGSRSMRARAQELDIRVISAMEVRGEGELGGRLKKLFGIQDGPQNGKEAGAECADRSGESENSENTKRTSKMIDNKNETD